MTDREALRWTAAALEDSRRELVNLVGFLYLIGHPKRSEYLRTLIGRIQTLQPELSRLARSAPDVRTEVVAPDER